jgi:hypothetical protein
MNRIYTFLVILSGLAVGIGVGIALTFLWNWMDKPQENLGAIEAKITQLSGEVGLFESNYFSSKKEYVQILPKVDASGIEYKVDQYKVWHGFGKDPDIGYQVYLTKPDGSTKSFGVGVLSAERSFDWRPLEIKQATVSL